MHHLPTRSLPAPCSTGMLTTCKMHPDDVNPCTAKGVPKDRQQLYAPDLQSCPVMANQTCSCPANASCVEALYWVRKNQQAGMQGL